VREPGRESPLPEAPIAAGSAGGGDPAGPLADYCFTVKDNESTLNSDIDRLFEQTASPPSA